MVAAALAGAALHRPRDLAALARPAGGGRAPQLAVWRRLAEAVVRITGEHADRLRRAPRRPHTGG